LTKRQTFSTYWPEFDLKSAE